MKHKTISAILMLILGVSLWLLPDWLETQADPALEDSTPLRIIPTDLAPSLGEGGFVDVAAGPPPTDQPLKPLFLPAVLNAKPSQVSSLLFTRARLQRCEPNPGVTYVSGTTYQNGQPANGYTVGFSYAPDGPLIATITSGPHEGYESWETGFYSYMLDHAGPREGHWYFWIVDETGQRISVMAYVHTDGEAGEGKCQQAIIDFDS